MKRLFWMCLTVWMSWFGFLKPAFANVGMPVDELPVTHSYQKVLRDFMATLTEADLAVAPQPFEVVPDPDDETAYRLWILLQSPPSLGVAWMPAADFTLASIEAATGLSLPAEASLCQSLAWLAAWDYAGNPYRNNSVLKLRAFILAAIDMIMLDHLYEHDPQGAARSDFLGGNLIWIGYTFGIVQDILPPPVRSAFVAGLRRLVLDYLNDWGPTGAMTDMDLFAPVGLWYISQAVDEPDLKTVARAYARRLFTDERYYHPAGYFVDNHCFDTSYNGISLYFGVWAALMSDWDFTHRAIEQALRLRAHLCFPDPAGGFSGPSAMSSRTSGDPSRDQWRFPQRLHASAMVGDEAIYEVAAQLPEANALAEAPARLVQALNRQMEEATPAQPQPWGERHWSRQMNFAHDHYRPGQYARLQRLRQEASSLLLPLYHRGETFVRNFADALIIARLGRMAFAIHVGPVGRPVGHNGLPYGFGGGALAVFWTPESGAALVARRRGVQGAVVDAFDEWRQWPVHAVSGLTAANELVSSSRIEIPQVQTNLGAERGEVRVEGRMPKYNPARSAIEPSGLDYERSFIFSDGGLTIATCVRSDGAERLQELYETIPVLLSERGESAATIEFGVGDRWLAATAEMFEEVKQVRITRFHGRVLIRFAEPRRVRLSPAVWSDGYQTQAQCRTVLVDLLGDVPRPTVIDTVALSYTLISADPLPTETPLR